MKIFPLRFFIVLFLSAAGCLGVENAAAQALDAKHTEPAVSATDSSNAVLQEPLRIKDIQVIRTFSDSLRQESGFPVTVNGKELFRLYGKIGDIGAEKRAEKTSRLLTDFFRSSSPVDSLMTIEAETMTAVVGAQKNILAAFGDEDAAAEHMSRQELARTVLNIISKEVSQYREETSGGTILFSILKAFALLVALGFVWHFLNKFFTLLESWIQKIRIHYRKEGKNKLISDVFPDHLAAGLGWLSRITELFLKIVLIYAYLTTVLSFFPWTADLSTNLLSFVLDPAKQFFNEFVELIPTVVTIVLLILIIRYLGKFSDLFFKNISKGELRFGDFDAEWAEPTRKIVKIVLYLLLASLFFVSFPLKNNLALLVFFVLLGLAFSLGAVPTVQNIISGIMLNYTGSLRAGDRIKLGEVTGELVAKSPLVIRIKNSCNETVVIPNSTAFRSKIINYTDSVQKNGHLSLELVLYLKENIPFERLDKEMIEAALATDGIMLDPKPVLLKTSPKNGFSGYRLRANMRDSTNMERVYSRLWQNVQTRLQENKYTMV